MVVKAEPPELFAQTVYVVVGVTLVAIPQIYPSVGFIAKPAGKSLASQLVASPPLSIKYIIIII
jgi:hypothetical protein